jgi:uncharacterized protein (DUF2267 family)
MSANGGLERGLDTQREHWMSGYGYTAPSKGRRSTNMGDFGYSTFTTTVDKTNRVLNEIEHAYGWPKERRNQSYAALRAVLHALRDRLTVNEAAQFAAQLPMLIRGIYFHGWQPSDVPVKMDKEQFLERVRQEFPYDVKGGMEPLVQTVLEALKEYVTEGEWDDIRSSMPKELATIVP